MAEQHKGHTQEQQASSEQLGGARCRHWTYYSQSDDSGSWDVTDRLIPAVFANL